MATFDENELNVSDGLEYSMNNKEFYVGILDTYLEETQESIVKMDEAIETGDMKLYSTLVHAIKSSSRLIGANPLGEDAYELELKSKDDDIEFVKAHHQALKDHIDVVYGCIEAYKAE